MAISAALGERRTVEVPAGTLEYRERGSGPPVVFVHGAAVNGDLWRKVAPELAERRRASSPTCRSAAIPSRSTRAPTCRSSAPPTSLRASSTRSA